MAFTTMQLLHVTPLPHVRNANPISCMTHSPKPTARRHFLVVLTATSAAMKALEFHAKAEDIGLFGIRKRIKKAEEEVEEVVKEGIENAEKGLENAEKGFENVEKGFENAEKRLINEEVGLGFGSLAQAGAVAGAEVVGVLVATSVVNGILGPEARKL